IDQHIDVPCSAGALPDRDRRAIRGVGADGDGLYGAVLIAACRLAVRVRVEDALAGFGVGGRLAGEDDDVAPRGVVGELLLAAPGVYVQLDEASGFNWRQVERCPKRINRARYMVKNQ